MITFSNHLDNLLAKIRAENVLRRMIVAPGPPVRLADLMMVKRNYEDYKYQPHRGSQWIE